MSQPIKTKSPTYTANEFSTNAGDMLFLFRRDTAVPFERGFIEQNSAAKTSFMASEPALAYISAIGFVAAEDGKLQLAKDDLAAAERRVKVVESAGMGKALEHLDKCRAALERAQRSYELLQERFNEARAAAVQELKRHEQQFHSEISRLAVLQKEEALVELAANEAVLDKYFRAKAALTNGVSMPHLDELVPAGKAKPAPVVSVPADPGPAYVRQLATV